MEALLRKGSDLFREKEATQVSAYSHSVNNPKKSADQGHITKKTNEFRTNKYTHKNRHNCNKENQYRSCNVLQVRRLVII